MTMLAKNKKINKLKLLRRTALGIALGALAGLAASHIAGSVGSQCMILCNQTVAVPYFAVIGLLVSWR